MRFCILFYVFLTLVTVFIVTFPWTISTWFIVFKGKIWELSEKRHRKVLIHYIKKFPHFLRVDLDTKSENITKVIDYLLC